MRRNKRKQNGLALIIAMFTVFAFLTMGVTYIGISFTNSRAAAGFEREAMAVNYANAGLEFALNIMGSPENWDPVAGKLTLMERTAKYTPLLYSSCADYPAFKVEKLTKTDEFWRSDYKDTWHLVYGKVITTNTGEPLKQLWIDNKQKGEGKFYGYWRILVYPESDEGLTSAGIGSLKNNLNFRIIVRARIQDKATVDSTARNIASREILARVNTEIKGSIYQNVRSYDAAGGFHYPNTQECTADAVFVSEGFEWDGDLVVDGPVPATKPDGTPNDRYPNYGKPQQTISFDKTSGWVADGSDVSGSLKIDLIDDAVDKSKWPKFRGFVCTQKKELANTDTVSGQVTGIKVETFMKNTTTDETKNIFLNKKDGRYQTGKPAMDVINNVWKADKINPATGQTYEKLGLYESNGSGTGNVQTGYFEDLTKAKGNGNGWYVDVSNNEIKPDPYTAYDNFTAPTVKITVTAMDNGKTRYFVEKLIRNPEDNNGTNNGGTWTAPGATQTEYGAKTSWTFESDNNDFNNVIYVKGGNVMVVGGSPNSSVATDDNGKPDRKKGHLTTPLTIVSDSDPTREKQMEKARANATSYSTDSGPFDGRLSACNVWDKVGNRYLYQSYDTNGNRMFGTGRTFGGTDPANQKPIWQATDAERAVWEDKVKSGEYEYRFPAGSANINNQPEGNVTVAGDLVYKDSSISTPNRKPTVLGIVAKNHVYLNDFKMVEKADTTADAQAKRTLELDAVVASQNHSMQMDFFNFSKNPYGMNHITANLDGTAYTPSWVGESLTKVPCADGDIAGQGTMKYINKWKVMPTQARRQEMWDFYYGAKATDQTDNAGNTNYNFIYQSLQPKANNCGSFKFNGSVISRFADVEADAGDGTATGAPPMGYQTQNMRYDENLKSQSAPFFSTSDIDKRVAQSRIVWNVLSYVDRGAGSETIKNL